jgi:GTP-binding protein
LDFFEFLGVNGVPFSIVFTKADKQSKTKTQKNVEDYKTKLLETWEELPPIFITSSETGEGCEELLDYIDSINHSFNGVE